MHEIILGIIAAAIIAIGAGIWLDTAQQSTAEVYRTSSVRL